MGRSELPNKIEFDRIVEEAFSSGERHSFSEQYRQKKDNIQRGMIMKKMNNKSERIFVGAVAAAVLAVVAVPTGVVIKNSLEPDKAVPGTNDAAVLVDVPEEETDPMAAVEPETEIVEAPEVIEEGFKTYEFGWLPEGMSVDPDGWKIHDEERLACITPVLYKISPEQELLPHANFTTGSMDEYDLDGRHVKIFTSCLFRTVEENFFGRNVWITFEGSKYAVFLYVSDALDDNDLAQIIENISLVDTDEDRGAVYVEPSEVEQNAEPTTVVEGEAVEESADSITRDDLTLYSIGDLTVDEVDLGDGRVRSMNVSVNDAYITDNFDGLTTDGIGRDADFSEFTDENGKITDAVIEYFDVVEQPDGPDGIYVRETIGTESVASKILVVDLTYTNNSDFQDDYCVCPSLMTIADSVLEPIEFAEMHSTEYSSFCNMDKLDSERHLAFSLYADSNKGDKNGVVLDSGESANVKLAFLLRENEVGNLYLNLTSSGLEGSTLIDLCNIEER